MARKRIQTPAHLSADAAAFYVSTVETFELEAHHLHLLTLACEALDRAAEAREAIKAHGLLIEAGSGSLKPNPACAIERDSRLAFARLCRELDLDHEPPARDARPPALRSNRR